MNGPSFPDWFRPSGDAEHLTGRPVTYRVQGSSPGAVERAFAEDLGRAISGASHVVWIDPPEIVRNRRIWYAKARLIAVGNCPGGRYACDEGAVSQRVHMA